MEREHFVVLTTGLMLTMFGAGSAIGVMPNEPPAPIETGPAPMLLQHSPAAKQRGGGSPAANQVIADYGKLPLAFEANAGQTDGRVKFLSRGSGYTLFLTGNEAVLTLSKSAGVTRSIGSASVALKSGATGLAGQRKPAESPQANTNSVLRMKLIGAKLDAAVTGASELPGKSNYFIGKDPKKWRTNVPNYAKVKYPDVYPGVDLVYYGNRGGQLEYDFVVAPGADPSAISLHVAAASMRPAKDERRAPLRIASDGDLVVRMDDGEIRFHKPVVYQNPSDGFQRSTGNGRRALREGRFVLTASNQVSFALGPYDHSKPLIIDPVLSYSTYLGGSTGSTLGNAIAVDASGNAYIAGLTNCTDFPTTPNAFQTTFGDGGDAFITKLAPSGSTLVYSTYLDGTGGAEAYGIAVDASGAAYVTGETSSSDFPTLNPVQGALASGALLNAFISKLDPSGAALVYSTYYGGSGTNTAYAIAVDASGDAYVAGRTLTGFPTVNALQSTYGGNGDAFVVKLNPAGTAVTYATYLGGSESDYATSIAVDSGGNAYIAGQTVSTDFPTQTPFQPANGTLTGTAFAAKLNASGSALVYSTYLGGSTSEIANAIAVDGSGDAFVGGETGSTNFPTHNPLQATNAAAAGGGSNGFIAEFNPAGSALVYSSYLGGSTTDEITGVALDSAGNTYVGGITSSADFPTVNPLPVSDGGLAANSIIAEISVGGSALLFSSHFGSNSIGQTTMTTGENTIAAIAVDASGSVYVTGATNAATFPTLNAFQATYQGSENNAFVAKISLPSAASPTVTISAAPTTIMVGQSSTLTWDATNATSCTASGAWSGTQATSGTLSETLAQSGTSTYTLTCTGAGGSAHASAVVTVDAAAPTVTLSVKPTSITLGQSITLTWTSTNATSCSASGAWSGTLATSGALSVTPSAAGSPTYTLTCSGAASATAMSDVNVSVSSEVATATILSGKAGGGSMELWSLLSLGLLVAYRMRRLQRPALLGTLAVLAAVAILAAAAPVSAQQASPEAQFRWDQTYVGIRAGSGTYWESSRQLDADLVAAGESGTSTSIDQRRTAGVAYAGVPFYKSLSLELGVADLGMYPVGISTSSANIPQLAQTIVRNLSPAGRALTLNLTAPLDINTWLAFEPRAGIFGYQSTQEVYTPIGSFSHDREGAGIDAGFAVLLRPTRSLYIGAGLDCFDIDGRCTVLLYSAEIEYHFGR